MLLDREQLAYFEDRGYLVVPGLFSPREVEVLRAELPLIFAQESPARILEQDRKTVRLVYGVHLSNYRFQCLTRHPRLLYPAKQLLGGSVYIHQSKITAKNRIYAAGWPWHQDYRFWRSRDGVPSAMLVSAVVFLDDVNETNGPMFFLVGSHKGGLFEAQDYELCADLVHSLANQFGLSVPHGKKGTVLFFHANLVHGSPSNISPFGRTLGFVTYNRIENAPHHTTSVQPAFIAADDFRPAEALADGVLLESSDVLSERNE